MLLAFFAGDIQLRCAKARRQTAQQRACIWHAADNLQQARTRVRSVVKTVPAFFEKDMPTHLAAQRGVNFAHLRLDQRVAGFVHQRHAACGGNHRGQTLRTFHVKHDGAAGYAAQYITRKQHHLAVRVNVLAVFGDNAQTVTVAVKGQAQFSARCLQGCNQITQVFRLAGVRVVIGEVAIDLAEQLGDLTAQCPKNRRGRRARNAVARVDHDFHGARQLDVTHNALPVSRVHTDVGDSAR